MILSSAAAVLLGVFLLFPTLVSGDEPMLHATVGRADSTIRFMAQGDRTIVNITSKSGIDKATIQRSADRWPPVVVVRLHLGGLESFQATNGTIALEASVSSTGNHPTSVRVRTDGQEGPNLGEDSPYWTEVRMVGGNGKIPLKNGFFEMTLPPKFFETNPRSIGLRWIDFYRG